MLQVIEEIEKRYLTIIGEETISVYIGKKSGKLLGFQISSGGKFRDINFAEIDRMKKTLELM